MLCELGCRANSTRRRRSSSWQRKRHGAEHHARQHHHFRPDFDSRIPGNSAGQHGDASRKHSYASGRYSYTAVNTELSWSEFDDYAEYHNSRLHDYPKHNAAFHHESNRFGNAWDFPNGRTLRNFAG